MLRNFEERVRLLQRVLPQALAEAQRRIARGETAAETLSEIRSERDLVPFYAHSFIEQPMLRAAAGVLTPQAIGLLSGEDVIVRGERFSEAQRRQLLSQPPALPASAQPIQGTVTLVRWRYEPFGSQINVSVYIHGEGTGGGGSGSGLPLPPLQEIAKLPPFQQHALGLWASTEADRFGREGDYRAVVYDTPISLTYAEGTVQGIWRLLMALPPAAQLRALSGQRVVINDFAPVVKLPMEDLIPPFFPIDVAQTLPSTRIWVQAKRVVTRHWACEKPRFESVRRLGDLWLSKPGETLADFRRRLREEEKVDSDRFVQVEVETITLRLGTGNKALVEPEVQLARFKRGTGSR